MSIPRICTKCGKTIGVVNPGDHMHIPSTLGYLMGDRVDLGFDRIEKASRFDPQGPCNHPEPEWIKERRFFGLIEKITKIYPDGSISRWEEYIGKPQGLNLLLLWVYVKIFRHNIYIHDIHDWIFHDLASLKEIREKVRARVA